MSDDEPNVRFIAVFFPRCVATVAFQLKRWSLTVLTTTLLRFISLFHHALPITSPLLETFIFYNNKLC